METILIAGATGYLGQAAAAAFKKHGFYTKVLVRNPEKFRHTGIPADEILEAEVTQPDTLRGICAGADIVFSCVGITKQKEGLSYHDVDYQANMNLLKEAVDSGVKRFMYISVLNGEKLKKLKICAEKERFVDALMSAPIEHIVIRPNGYFSDMGAYFDMARKGKIFIIGKGDNRINPISGADLAEFCVENSRLAHAALDVGGPEIFTHNEIAGLAMQAYGKNSRVIHIPKWIVQVVLGGTRIFTSSKVYGPVEFVMTILMNNMVTKTYGKDSLMAYFKSLKSIR